MEFVSFVSTSIIGKTPPIWTKKIPFVSHIYLGVFKTLGKQNNLLFDRIYFQDFVSFWIFLGGVVPDPVLDCFLLLSILEDPMR